MFSAASDKLSDKELRALGQQFKIDVIAKKNIKHLHDFIDARIESLRNKDRQVDSAKKYDLVEDLSSILGGGATFSEFETEGRSYLIKFGFGASKTNDLIQSTNLYFLSFGFRVQTRVFPSVFLLNKFARFATRKKKIF